MSDNKTPSITDPAKCPNPSDHDEFSCNVAWDLHCNRHQNRENALGAQVKTLRAALLDVRVSVEHTRIGHTVRKHGDDYQLAFDETCQRCRIDKALSTESK